MENLEELLEFASRAENKGEYLVASRFYKNTLEQAKRADDKAAIKTCKEKLVEMNRRLKEDPAMRTATVTLSADHIQAMEQAATGRLTGDTAEDLRVICDSSDLVPRYERISRQAAQSMPVTYQIASLGTSSEDGHELRGGSDPVYAWRMVQYQINTDLIKDVGLPAIFRVLRSREDFKCRTVVDFMGTGGGLDEDQLELVTVAVERYFARDYVSALHIFIPQLEGIFMQASANAGLDAVALSRGGDISTSTRVLSPHFLSKEEIQATWGKDFCELLKFSFFEPLGYRLRHKVAHGEVTFKECNMQTTDFVLFLFLLTVKKSTDLSR